MKRYLGLALTALAIVIVIAFTINSLTINPITPDEDGYTFSPDRP